MPAYVELSSLQVGLVALLILVNGMISITLRLGMERTLLWAACRTILQLILIGLILEWVFRMDRWYVVMGITSVMTLIAGVTAAQRNRYRIPGMWINTVLSIWAGCWLVAAYGLAVLVHGNEPWYQPQYTIPLLGMILGNTMNGTSIGLSSLTESLFKERDQVEMALALGASRWEAARVPVRHAVRTGMIPIVNAMLVVGIVSLPGMMTGQLLAGAEPMDAVKYQIVILFLIASATALGTVSVVLLSYLRLFNSHHQFFPGRITQRPSCYLKKGRKLESDGPRCTILTLLRQTGTSCQLA